MIITLIAFMMIFWGISLFTRANYQNALHAAQQSAKQVEKLPDKQPEHLFASALWSSDRESRPNT